ncbi:MAG: folylpolyglutamate synthase/dihydrofolate synthase family protein [Dehalococcoidales bacterium]|jgi:dihydrofolate synthase/folylpolyglutamate synthase
MNYQEALDYVLKFADYERLPRSGIVWDIKRIERLLARLDNPHLFAKSVHVAGTKGKGSTSAMIASILKSAGYKTGLYTSPHLLDYTERIQVDGKPIARADWAKVTEIVQPHVEAENALGDLGQLTTFEIFTAMAFLHFQRVKADWQVMEVGLGGRLDATNVVKPEVCVITSISYDHMDVLGDTLGQIAWEKCGIIKPGAVVVSAPQFPEAMETIESESVKKGAARLIRVGKDINWERLDFTTEGQRFRVKGLKGNYEVWLPLLGGHQIENAANAVAAVEVLTERGAKITPQNIIEGLKNVHWPGRLQVLRQKPWVIADGAHNAYSVQRLGEALREYFKYDKAKLILGFGADKDIPGMVREAVKITGDIVLVASHHPRAVKAEALTAEFQKHGVTPRTAESVKDAVKLALGEAGPNDLICAAGSIFVEAELLEMMGDGSTGSP